MRGNKSLRNQTMRNDQIEFLKNTLRVCQEIQNRFYSERIKLGDIDPEEPWWFSKVALIAKNAELVLSDASAATAWTSDFNTPSS